MIWHDTFAHPTVATADAANAAAPGNRDEEVAVATRRNSRRTGSSRAEAYSWRQKGPALHVFVYVCVYVYICR